MGSISGRSMSLYYGKKTHHYGNKAKWGRKGEEGKNLRRKHIGRELGRRSGRTFEQTWQLLLREDEKT